MAHHLVGAHSVRPPRPVITVPDGEMPFDPEQPILHFVRDDNGKTLCIDTHPKPITSILS